MNKQNNQLQAAMAQTDAIMALEGFERSPGIEALDAAILAGRASLSDAGQFIALHAKMVGAQSVLAQIGQDDSRRAVIEARYQEQLAQLRSMAITMDGAVRVAYGL
jgi:hypothetical protein